MSQKSTTEDVDPICTLFQISDLHLDSSVDVCVKKLDGNEFSNYQISVVRGDVKMPKSKGARNSGASNEGLPMIRDHNIYAS